MQSLLVDTYYGYDDYEACPRYMASLFYLLAHLTGLRTLNLQIYSMPLLPPLSRLKELSVKYTVPYAAPSVKIARDSLRSLLGCLNNMTSHERLCLDASPSDPRFSPNLGWIDEWSPPLDFAMLPKLESVGLKCFLPEGIVLPSACALDLCVYEKGSITELRRWQYVLDNLVLFSLYDRDVDMSVVPDLLCEDLPRLTSVKFNVTTIGGSDAHFFPSYALRHVKALEMVASVIQLHIPADVTWEVVTIEAFHKLSITFEDVAVFVRMIHRFQIRYMYASGSFLADLCCELGKQGLHWKANQCGARTTLCLDIAEGDDFGSMYPIEVSCNQ